LPQSAGTARAYSYRTASIGLSLAHSVASHGRMIPVRVRMLSPHASGEVRGGTDHVQARGLNPARASCSSI
jgi:hypothetical protein